jgi:hypothetical protein
MVESGFSTRREHCQFPPLVGSGVVNNFLPRILVIFKLRFNNHFHLAMLFKRRKAA